MISNIRAIDQGSGSLVSVQTNGVVDVLSMNQAML